MTEAYARTARATRLQSETNSKNEPKFALHPLSSAKGALVHYLGLAELANLRHAVLFWASSVQGALWYVRGRALAK